ncbi:HD-GYP domain-containing protein [Novosphingobium piscinae]|uniref:DUF3391 domain-containing protein n=1 Tax=Novosphingobium piscinae TaxID=1507448 RepID=A0A7X1FVZ5_9SPHN|nr:HD-GYP domain-containing protein [Novosphingobium piscinae]MBC2667988.1 DUF3391 domain-containing protein [Novosphingobium piscinae]
MLKRIDIADLELGMFVHKLEGSWFKHPFWRSKFVLDDQDTLDELQASEVPAVIIDTERGIDLRPTRIERVTQAAANGGVAVQEPPLRRGLRTQRVAAAPRSEDVALTSTVPLSQAREFGHANRVVDRSRKVISKVFLEARLGKTIRAETIEPVVEEIFASVQRNPHAFNGLMRCKRDLEYVYRHALAVSALMVSLGRQMKLSPADQRLAGMAGLMLDMGVSYLPVDLESTGGDFRRIDERIFREHARLGHDQLLASGVPEPVALACLEHHERIDGTGYPHGLTGERISLFGRMAAICDTYDWLVNDAQDQMGLDPSAAMQQLTLLDGAFDRDLLASFIDALGVYPIGSVVELASGRLALVVSQDEADPAKPRVKTFYSLTERRIVPTTEILLARCYGEDRIIAAANPDALGGIDFPAIREKLFASA